MIHAVLLGDSIFDNGRYVPGHPDVVAQLRQELAGQGTATLLAVDGHVTSDVSYQLRNLPTDASHLFVSVGGNDALRASGLLYEEARTVASGIDRLRVVLDQFRSQYTSMLDAVARSDKPTTLCTVYDSIPGLAPSAVTALGGFNEVILRCAFERGLPVIDLRLVCNESADYSASSPIEPSHLGGAKIARVIVAVLREHDFNNRRTVVYV